MKIAIKSNLTDEIIFEHDCENNCLKTTLEAAIKKGVKLMYADFPNADLRGANLKNACLFANMIGADLRGANLKNAYICGGCYAGANLEGANLEGAILMGSDFFNVNLKNANLTNANLFSVNLEEATLAGAQLHDADFIANAVETTNFSNTLYEENLVQFKKRQAMEKKQREGILGYAQIEIKTT